MKRSELVAAVQELNSVLGLEPPILLKAKVPVLKEKIKQASELIDPAEDEFSDDTWKVLKECGVKLKQKQTNESREETMAENQEQTETIEEQNQEQVEAVEEGTQQGGEEESVEEDVQEDVTEKTPVEKAEKKGGKIAWKDDSERTVFNSRVNSKTGKIDQVIASGKALTTKDMAEQSGVKTADVLQRIHFLIKKKGANIKIGTEGNGKKKTYQYKG